MMDLYASAAGLVRAEIVSADLVGTLQRINGEGIVLHNISGNDGIVMYCTLSRTDFSRVREICAKQGAVVKMKRRWGIYWAIKRLLARPVLLTALAVFFVAALYLPSRIFFVRVEGNVRLPERMILEAASRCGIGFGAARLEVRSERMKNALLETMPGLQWAGVNTYGCVAVITVRERSAETDNPPSGGVGHIVALRDAVITQCSATRGNMLCAPGQAVSRGQVLISGYTDCGLHIRAELAQGEVYGQTSRTLDAVLPTFCRIKRDTGEEKKKISVLIGKKRINLWKDSGIWDTTCDRMYEEYYITLPGGFQLPLALIVERYSLQDVSESESDTAGAREFLKDYTRSFLMQQMIAGTIRDSQAQIWEESGYLRLAGEYDCTELIGAVQQIGEYNGKSD